MKAQFVSMQAILLFLITPHVYAVPITVIEGIAPLSITEDFENYPQGSNQFAFNAIGALIGESFIGQTVIGGGGNTKEEVSGLPSSPLNLNIFPNTDDGVYIADISTQFHTIFGLADGTNPDDIGEGVMAVLFDSPQSLFGITLLGHGSATFQFFSTIGDLIDSDTLLLPQKNPLSVTHLTISSIGPDISGFSLISADHIPTSGVSGGFGIDDLRLSRIPEPNILLLFLVGLVGLVGLRCGIKSKSSKPRFIVA